MHSTYIKIKEAQQTIMYNIYKNTKLNLLNKRTLLSCTTKYVKPSN